MSSLAVSAELVCVLVDLWTTLLAVSYTFLQQFDFQCQTSGHIRVAPKLDQIGPKMGQIWDFLRSVFRSLWLGLIWCQYGPIEANSDIPGIWEQLRGQWLYRGGIRRFRDEWYHIYLQWSGFLLSIFDL